MDNQAKTPDYLYSGTQTIEQQVDRIEVIDETGRAYVKGSIYGTPVAIELSYQDDGKTLKIFVTPKEKNISNTQTVGELVGQASTLFYNKKTKLLDGVFDEKQAQEIVDKIEALIVKARADERKAMLDALPEKKNMATYESNGININTELPEKAVGEQLVQLAKFADDQGYNQAISDMESAIKPEKD